VCSDKIKELDIDLNNEFEVEYDGKKDEDCGLSQYKTCGNKECT